MEGVGGEKGRVSQTASRDKNIDVGSLQTHGVQTGEAGETGEEGRALEAPRADFKPPHAEMHLGVWVKTKVRGLGLPSAIPHKMQFPVPQD